MPVLCPSGMSPGTSASASPLPGPSGSSSPSGDGDGTEFELPPRATLRILQWNADGIGNKKMELKALMERLDVHAVTLQESKLSSKFQEPHGGECPNTLSHIFQKCPQLAVERADTGVSNPRDLWGAPAVALRFVGAIGLIPGLD